MAKQSSNRKKEVERRMKLMKEIEVIGPVKVTEKIIENAWSVLYPNQEEDEEEV